MSLPSLRARVNRIAFASLLVPFSLVACLLGCGEAPGAAAERRVFFSDDLRAHSIRPDGTGLHEFPGKSSTSPLPVQCRPGEWRVLCASYRGPYLLLDEPRPGLYETSLSGRHRRRILDLPELPVLIGLTSGGDQVLLRMPGAEPGLRIVDRVSGLQRDIPLSAPVRAAAVDPGGGKAAVVLEPKLKTVVLGNQAWFTEGSDLVLVTLASGTAESLVFPALPDPLGAEPKLEYYAGSAVSAVAWSDDHTLLVSSAPGMWNLDLRDPSSSRMARPRMPDLPPADGLAFSRDRMALAFTCGGRLFVWDMRTGAVKDITPQGLIGGAHHPAWMEP